jgi:hypothetical protein
MKCHICNKNIDLIGKLVHCPTHFFLALNFSKMGDYVVYWPGGAMLDDFTYRFESFVHAPIYTRIFLINNSNVFEYKEIMRINSYFPLPIVDDKPYLGKLLPKLLALNAFS